MTLHFRITKTVEKDKKTGKEEISFKTEYAGFKFALKPMGFISFSQEDLKADVAQLIDSHFKEGS